ncbi:hypothetical protein [Dyadobacter sp. NIV53]|uniref:hypothetical protein n=1 Tax=Dyadobacter sp. NIV53 TaxID=2861765 RepID=UPI001C86BDD6|nr:hypothetical protein [Dyadobacter sp. NIV53]
MEVIFINGKNPESWHYPDFTKIKKEQITENSIEYNDEFRIGFGKELILKDVYIWYGKFCARSKKRMLVLSSGPHIQMNFSLQNATTYFTEILPRPFVRFKPHQHNLLLLPKKICWCNGIQVKKQRDLLLI